MKIVKFLFVAIILSLSEPLLAQNTPTITINISRNNDSILYLCYTYGDKLFVADTSELINKKYIFKSDERFPSGMYYIVNQNKNKLFDILIDNKYRSFEIIVDSKNILPSLTAKHSKINSNYFNYLRFISYKQNEIEPYIKQLSITESNSKQNSQLKDEINFINLQVQNYIENFAKKNKNNILGLFLKAGIPVKNPRVTNPELTQDEAYFQYLDNFFENFDVADSRLLRTPIFQEKINEYLDRITLQNPEYIIISVDKLLDKVLDSEEVLKYLLWHVTAKYEQSTMMGFDAVFVHIVDKYYVRGIDTWTHKGIIDALINKANELRSTLLGEKAPDIKLADINLKPTNLYSVDAPFTLVYFWTDDCSNCKEVTQKLLNNYVNYKENYGMEIFGVYMGNSLEKMKDYIDKNKIPWINTYLHTNQDTDYIFLYNINSTPYILLLDKGKKVIAKRLDVGDLDKVLEWQNR